MTTKTGLFLIGFFSLLILMGLVFLAGFNNNVSASTATTINREDSVTPIVIPPSFRDATGSTVPANVAPIHSHNGKSSATVATQTIQERKQYGLPALNPKISPELVATADINTPNILETDVINYVNTNKAGPLIKSNSSITVEKVEFLTVGEVNSKLNVKIGVPDNTLLCLVTIKGSFSIPAPPDPTKKATTDTPKTISYDVFDALTGNLMMTSIK